MKMKCTQNHNSRNWIHAAWEWVVSTYKQTTLALRPPHLRGANATRLAGGVMEQMRRAVAPGNRLSFLFGCILGGVVPLITWHTAHFETHGLNPFEPAAGFRWVCAWLIIGAGFVVSGITVWQWAYRAFGGPLKSTAFVVLFELGMLTSQYWYIHAPLLCLLILINGFGTGASLALDTQEVRDQLRNEHRARMRGLGHTFAAAGRSHTTGDNGAHPPESTIQSTSPVPSEEEAFAALQADLGSVAQEY